MARPGVGRKPQLTVRLAEHQRAFWERKKKDLRKRLHSSQRSMISNSSVFQALVELWMVLDADGDIEEKIREFQARHRTPEEEDDEESSSDAH